MKNNVVSNKINQLEYRAVHAAVIGDKTQMMTAFKILLIILVAAPVIGAALFFYFQMIGFIRERNTAERARMASRRIEIGKETKAETQERKAEKRRKENRRENKKERHK